MDVSLYLCDYLLSYKHFLLVIHNILEGSTKQNLCARCLLSTQFSLFRPVSHYTQLHTRSQEHHSLLAWNPFIVALQGFGGGSVGGGVGGTGEVMWWDFKALCLLRGTVISGGRGEV